MIKAIKVTVILLIGGALYTNVCYMRKSSELSSISEVGVISEVERLKFEEFIFNPADNGLVAIYKDSQNIKFSIQTDIEDTDGSKYIQKYESKKIYVIKNNQGKRIGIFEPF